MKTYNRLFTAFLAILLITAYSFGSLVDGICYLEGETDHSGTKVLFVEASPTAVTDSVYTGASGDYQLDVAPGLYDVYYIHDGFCDQEIIGQNCFDPITLPDVTLLSMGGIPISGPQSGVLAGVTYLVVGDLSIIDGESLTIEPGAVFLFEGDYWFTIGSNRTLLCQGTETDSIKFMPNYDGGITEWGGIDFSSSGSDDILEFCLITGSTTSGISCYNNSSPTISYCTISGNSAYEGGGGIYCYNSSPTISNCTISGNSVHSGGGIYCEGSSPTISNCTISGNSSNFGGGISCNWDSSPTISNCTISGNSAGVYGGGIYCYNSSPTISNCAVTDNTGEGIHVSSGSPEITYGDFYNNSSGDFGGGSINPNLGVIVTTNANGDPCDGYLNIFLDPLYVDPDNGDYHLQETSPCIDAGDPLSPLDPDDTVADIGAFYFDQSVEPVEVTLTPTSSTELPAGGGTLEFDVNVVSNVPDTYSNVMFWTKVKLPNGNFYPQIQFQMTFTLTPYMDFTGSLTQDVPAFAPEGTYEMWGWVGFNPNGGPSFGGFFPFTKSAAVTGGSNVNDWASEGYMITDNAAPGEVLPMSYEMKPVYPNPFNPTTTVSISLPEAADLSVAVYNVTGQQVAELANGQFSAGNHNLTLDASGMASGLYFVRATVPGQMDQVQKVMLVR